MESEKACRTADEDVVYLSPVALMALDRVVLQLSMMNSDKLFDHQTGQVLMNLQETGDGMDQDQGHDEEKCP